MSGFLDKNNRIVDMVLTGEGKYLLSKGALQFVYWIPFDDEVDYDPYIAHSSSLSQAELSSSRVEQIEATLVREATTGYRRFNKLAKDETNVHRPIFTMPQGQKSIPRMSSSNGIETTANIEVKQRQLVEEVAKKDRFGDTVEYYRKDIGYESYDSSISTLSYKYVDGSYPPDHKSEGFLLRIFKSGSDGLVEIEHRRDMSNDICFNNDLKIIPEKKK